MPRWLTAGYSATFANDCAGWSWGRGPFHLVTTFSERCLNSFRRRSAIISRIATLQLSRNGVYGISPILAGFIIHYVRVQLVFGNTGARAFGPASRKAICSREVMQK